MPFFSRKGEPLQNPYELLDLKLGATDDEISKAFKKLMFTLHPDKQPPGQSAEEALVVAQKLYDVMDAKSFLLDGEHLAAKREYDANLVKAAMQPPPPPIIPPVASAAQPPINNVGNSNNNNGMAMPSQRQQRRRRQILRRRRHQARGRIILQIHNFMWNQILIIQLPTIRQVLNSKQIHYHQEK